MRAISLAVATFFGLSLLVGCSLNDPPAVSSTPAETTAAPKEAGRSAEDIDGEGDPSSPSTTAAEVPSAEATEAAAAPTPLPPDANPALAVVGEVLIADGEPGQLSIVAQATSLERSGSLPIVVRNLTSEPIASLEVTGTIRDASGALAASGADQGLHPNLVGPGEIAIGYVYFGIDELPVDASFDLTVTGSDPSEIWAGRVDLIVSEHNLTADSVVVMLPVWAITPTPSPETDKPADHEARCIREVPSAVVF